jgi:hypothetical protein
MEELTITPPIAAIDGQLIIINGTDMYMYNEASDKWILLSRSEREDLAVEEFLSPQTPDAVVRKKLLEDKHDVINYDREWAHPEESEPEPKTPQEEIDREIAALLKIGSKDRPYERAFVDLAWAERYRSADEL